MNYDPKKQLNRPKKFYKTTQIVDDGPGVKFDFKRYSLLGKRNFE